SRCQEATAAVKFVAFLIVVVAALVLAPSVAKSTAEAAPSASLVGVVVALQAVVITYGGWQSALYFTEEDRDPDRNLPRSMIAGVASGIVVYVLVNVAPLAGLPVPDFPPSTPPGAGAAQTPIGQP